MTNEKNKTKDEAIPKGVLGKRKEQIRIKASDFISVYANNVGVAISNWDMTITFGKIIENAEKMLVEERVEIIMSKEIAKVLTLIMAKNFEVYESQFGKIVIPDFSKLESPFEESEKKQL